MALLVAPRAVSAAEMRASGGGGGGTSTADVSNPSHQRAWQAAHTEPTIPRLSLHMRAVDACAIQLMRSQGDPKDRYCFLFASAQLLSRKRLVALLSTQLAAPNAPAESLFIFTRDLFRHWRHASIPGDQLRIIIRAASACFSTAELNVIKLLAIAAAQSPPPIPRASPSLGRVPRFGATFTRTCSGDLFTSLSLSSPLPPFAASNAKLAEELAEWSALEEAALFSAVRPPELVRQAWQRDDKLKRAPNVTGNKKNNSKSFSFCFLFSHLPPTALVSHSNRLSLYIAAEIIGARDDDRQARVGRVHVALGVLRRALSLRAYNTAMAVFGGLNHGSVQRLKRLWMGVAPEQLKFFTDTEALLSHVGNYARLTAEIAAVPLGTPVMPYIGAALKDLALIHLGNRNFVGGKEVNFEKLRLLGRRIYALLRYQHFPFTHPWPMSSSVWAQAMLRADLPSEEELWHLSTMIEPKLYIPATDSAPARRMPFCFFFFLR